MVWWQDKVVFSEIKSVTIWHTTFYSLCICRHWTGWAYSHFLLTHKIKVSRRGCLELPGAGSAPLHSTAERGSYLRCFSAFPFSLYLRSVLWHIVTCDGFLTDYLKLWNPSLCKEDFFWTPSNHWWPLLEIFSWPFTSLSNWLCIWHRFLPNCPSQHDLLSYSASLSAHLFPLLKNMQV